MKRGWQIFWGLIVGAGAAAAGFLLVIYFFGMDRPTRHRQPVQEAESNTPPPAPITAGAPPEIRRQTVQIFQRAQTEDLRLIGVSAEIAAFAAPADRARQIVQLVLEGVPGETGAVPPAGPGLRYRDVYLASNGVAWVDLDGTTLGNLYGADEEQALIGALARSLVGAISEVRSVGLLVDGRGRSTLAGHVDLTRVYSGQEWPIAEAPSLEEATVPPPDAAGHGTAAEPLPAGNSPH